MAQFTYRANLSAKSFPFVSEDFGRSIIVPQYDNTYSRILTSQSDSDQDAGIPQMYYCHNVMPTPQGFQSIGYIQKFSAWNPPQISGVIDVFMLRTGEGNKGYLAILSNGMYSVNVSGTWTPPTFIVANTPLTNPVVTVAYVSGITYIYVAQVGCFKYNFANSTMESVYLNGLDPTSVNGITASSGYLIAWSKALPGIIKSLTTTVGSNYASFPDDVGLWVGQTISAPGVLPDGTTITAIFNVGPGLPAISVQLSDNALVTGTTSVTIQAQPSVLAWSSTIDPTDFVPSLTTGAGGGSVEGARGAIVFCSPSPTGFVVFTDNNAVAVAYTNNIRYPFTFREILGAGGLASSSMVAYAANASRLYAYTTSGFQVIGTQEAQQVFSDMTDFLNGQVFEDYDDVSNTFFKQSLTGPMRKRVTIAGDRFIVISYGVDLPYTHAIVYDMAQKRFGKFKNVHSVAIDFEPLETVSDITRNQIGFVNSRGQTVVADLSTVPNPLNVGVILLGKYQYVRQRALQLDEISIENVLSPDYAVVKLFTALDGKTNAVSDPYVTSVSGYQMNFGCRAVGLNHSLMIRGDFNLNSIILRFSLHGKR